jgi:dipeptidyl aminopeptidase/acylaminoacyl peptidase
MSRQLFLGLVLSAFASFAYADAPAPIPVKTFFTYSKVSGAKISPDGKYLAIAAANEKTGLEKNILVIISLDDMKPRASIGMVGDESIATFWWANDERVLVEGETKTGSLDTPVGDGKLYAINVDGTQKKLLLPYDPGANDTNSHMHKSVSNVVYFEDILYANPDKDPKHIVFQGYAYEGASATYHQQPKAYDLNIYTGEIRLLASGTQTSGTLVTDNTGAVRITTGDDSEGHMTLLYRATDEGQDWKDLSALLAGEDPAQVESEPLRFAPDNKHFYWLGRSKDGILSLYVVDPDTLTKTPLYEDPAFDVQDVLWSFKQADGSRIPIVADTMPGLPAVHVVGDDVKVDYIAQLYDAFQGQQVFITSETRDHSKLVVFVDSDRNPGDFYLYDTKANQMRQLFAVKPEIDPAKMATMMPITVTARDGVVMHGYLTLPPGSSGKNLPLIVNPHGGPHGPRDEWRFNPEVQLFANRGYAVLQLNFRGSGGYGLKFQQLGYRHWSSTMQDDLADGVAWTVKQGYVDPKRVCIYGASYGGYAAFENPIRYPDLYKCAVGYVGAYDLTVLGERGDISHFAGGSRDIDVYLGTDMEERKRESPVYNADKLNVPLLIAYGGADARVVPEHAKNMMAALDKAGKSYGEPIYYANEAHGFRDEDHNENLYTKMLAFFDKYIGPDAAKAGTPATASTGKP